MDKVYDLVSMGELVVEIFRKHKGASLSEPHDFIGPFPSGAPAITTDTMAKLGGKCAFLAAVGNDAFGTCCVNRLKHDGVDVSGVSYVDVITGIAFTSYDNDGGRSFIYNFTNAATAEFSPELLNAETIRKAKWLHISGNVMAFSAKSRAAVVRACEIAEEAGTKISFDPNIRLEIMDKDHLLELFEPVLKRASLVIPSEGELELIFGGGSEKECIDKLLSDGIKTVALKRGKRGCEIYEAHQEPMLIPAMSGVEEVDATGCGDSFCAGLVYGLNQGWDIRSCGLFANAVGGVTATKNGAMEGVQSIEDVRALLNKNGINI